MAIVLGTLAVFISILFSFSFKHIRQKKMNDAKTLSSTETEESHEITTVEKSSKLKKILKKHLGVPPARSVVFFDVDETLVMRKTFFVYGFQQSDNAREQLKKEFSEDKAQLILQDLEIIYSAAKPCIVDKKLVGLIRQLQREGHLVYALTSNERNSTHMKKNREILKKTGIKFSKLPLEGELYLTGAFLYNERDINGMIYSGNGKTSNKGLIVKEVYETCFCESHNISATNLVLIDNTFKKCTQAIEAFPEMRTIHYVQAEVSITPSDFDAKLNERIENVVGGPFFPVMLHFAVFSQ